jgi:site-specific DNA recombinase
MKATAIYVRVSTDRQAQAQTIQQQVERLQAHLAGEGQTLTEDHIFRDDGYSGASLNRPGLDQLRDRVSRACFERVLITSPDRLARRFVHQMLIIEEFERAGCEIQFLDRPMSQDPHDQLLLQIRGAVAEYERVLIAERMRRGRQLRLRSGTLLPWTTPPYGYRLAPDRPRDPAGVRIAPIEGALVQELFVRYLEPQGTLLGLAKYLLELGIPSPLGNARWSAASLRGILTNPAYMGKLCVGRRRSRPPRTRRSATHPLGKPARGADFTSPDEWTLVGSIPALVTEEVFDQVQKKLALNMKQASRNNKSHSYLLRALVSCGACQSACISRTTNGGRSYYACRCLAQPLYSGHDKRCRSRYTPADQLDTIVWQDLVALLREPESIVKALQRAHDGHWLPQQLQARRETLQKAQATLRQQLERLTEAYLAGVLQLPEYQRRRQELDTRNASLEQQTRELAAHVDRQQEISQMAASIEDFCQRIQTGLANASFMQKRTLVELLIDRVLVTNDEVEVRYVVPTHARTETTRFCHLRKDYFHNIIQVLTRADLNRVFPAVVELVAHAHPAERGMAGFEAI